MIAVWRRKTEIVDAERVDLLLHLADAGEHPHHARHAADLRHLVELLGEVVEIEDALPHPLGGLLGLLGVDIGGGLLDQADDVAHAEDAAGDALGVEILEPVEPLAGADQLDRLAGDGAHRERRAAAAVAVDAGEHDAGDADPLVEGLGEVDRVLAGQGVGDEQDLVRVGVPLDLGHLGHQRFVDMGAAGGVEDHHVVAAEPRRHQRAAADLDRHLAGDDRQRVDAGLGAEDAELLLRGRPARVERGHQDLPLVALAEALGELRRGGGLARALQADQHQRAPGRGR